MEQITQEQKLNLEKIDYVFRNYPDIVDVEQLCVMLGNINKKTAYRLLKSGEIQSIVVGHAYRIPKICVLNYLGLT